MESSRVVAVHPGADATSRLAQHIAAARYERLAAGTVAATFALVFVLSYATFALIKATIGLRVSEEEELAGLDISTHGMYGYPEAFIPQEEYPAGQFEPHVAGTPVAKPSTPATTSV